MINSSPPKNIQSEALQQINYIRLLEFLVVTATIITGIELDVYSPSHWLVVPIVLAYPLLAKLTLFLARTHHAEINRVLIHADAVLIGFSIAAIYFALIPSLMLLIIVNANALAMGGFKNWFFNVLAALLATIIGAWVFDFQVLPLDATPLWLDLISIAGAGMFMGVTSYYNHAHTRMLINAQKDVQQQQKKFVDLSKKLAKYLPPQVWGSLFSGKRDAKLETRRKKLTIFFSDIEGFSALSEELPLGQLTKLLNEYLWEMTKIAERYQATIDKFIGDAIMIFFGDPTTRGTKEDAITCVSMALDMQHHMKLLHYRWRKHGFKKALAIRIGINSGLCTVGNFGTETRMDYTVLGTDVNLASRLEAKSPANGILISEETYHLVKDVVRCRDAGKIQVKGFIQPQQVYQALDLVRNTGSEKRLAHIDEHGVLIHIDVNNISLLDKDKALEALAESTKAVSYSPRNIHFETAGCHIDIDGQHINEDRRTHYQKTLQQCSEALLNKG